MTMLDELNALRDELASSQDKLEAFMEDYAKYRKRVLAEIAFATVDDVPDLQKLYDTVLELEEEVLE